MLKYWTKCLALFCTDLSDLAPVWHVKVTSQPPNVVLTGQLVWRHRLPMHTLWLSPCQRFDKWNTCTAYLLEFMLSNGKERRCLCLTLGSKGSWTTQMISKLSSMLKSWGNKTIRHPSQESGISRGNGMATGSCTWNQNLLIIFLLLTSCFIHLNLY